GIDLDLTPNFIWIDVIPVNDPPIGADNTITTLEDVPYVLSAADFGFSDPSDTFFGPPNLFKAVILTSVPADDTLLLSGAPVLATQLPLTVPVTQLGDLVFQPALDESGAAYAGFSFRVKDDGGTANGGVDISLAPNTITFDVKPVNDAPSFSKGSDLNVTDESGPQSLAGWAMSVSAGPQDESAQQLHFVIQTNTNPDLFASPPSIDSSGKLTFTPAFNVAGSA